MHIAKLDQELRQNPRLRAAGGVGLLLVVGALFNLLNISMVQAATAAIAVPVIHSPIPATDPFSPLWDQATAADIPLSAQQMYQPGGGGSVQAVRVKAIQDGQRIAFLLSWADATRNDYVADMPSDAAAIQLPIDPHHLPYQCMGQTDSRVNIWQWKAALEQVARQSSQPYNGTRNLTSNGICKAVETDGVPPTATGTWKDGRWYVVYARDLAPAAEGTAPLEPGDNTNAAFAIWDGGKGETRGMKSVSTWIPLTLTLETGDTGATTLLALAISGLAAVGAIALAWRIIPH